jgi:hypothetical protein
MKDERIKENQNTNKTRISKQWLAATGTLQE